MTTLIPGNMHFLAEVTVSDKGIFLKSRKKEETKMNAFSLEADLTVGLMG